MNTIDNKTMEGNLHKGNIPSKPDQASSFFNQRISSLHLTMLLSLFFVLLFNKSFFVAAWKTTNIDSVNAILFAASLVPLLWFAMLFFIYLFCLPVIIKPVCVFFLVAGSVSAYFMDTYGVVIDKEMLRNVLETDSRESIALFSAKLAAYVFFIGALPSWMIFKVRIAWDNPWRELISRLFTTIIALVGCLLIILSLPSHYSSFFRNHKEVRLLANPLGFVTAGISLAGEAKKSMVKIEPISIGATLGDGILQQSKPVLMVLVVGEAARGASFGIAGYARDTTPLLSRQDIFYFNNFSSCGTSTAVSLPCMFSTLSRKEYKDVLAKSRHGLLDFIQNAGIDVLWRENNSGCKGVCDRVPTESFEHAPLSEWCNRSNCYDEVLLHDLNSKVSGNNQVIVLHQNGSHGPAYDRRYPESMRFYTPVCKTNQLQHCSNEEVVNAYDNTIRYTDYFLNQVIEWLISQQKTHNVAMMYVSDHGESLGENRLYLHGLPYAIAPEFQTRVPFIFWASSGFYQDRGLAKNCLSDIRTNDFSHDNLFHSVLGLIDINTPYYQQKMDIFSPCINHR